MYKFFTTLSLALMLSCSASAQVEQEPTDKISPAQAQRILNEEFLTEDVVKTTAPLKKHVEYVSTNYEEKQLKDLIRNAEEIERKVAQKTGEEYKPYDRQINVKNPAQVKRFLRKRLNVIY